MSRVQKEVASHHFHALNHCHAALPLPILFPFGHCLDGMRRRRRQMQMHFLSNLHVRSSSSSSSSSFFLFSPHSSFPLPKSFCSPCLPKMKMQRQGRGQVNRTRTEKRRWKRGKRKECENGQGVLEKRGSVVHMKRVAGGKEKKKKNSNQSRRAIWQ